MRPGYYPDFIVTREKNKLTPKYWWLSIVVHALLFLLLWIYKDTSHPRLLFSIQLVESQKRISKKEVTEIKKAIDKVQKEKMAAAKSKKKAGSAKVSSQDKNQESKSTVPLSKEERFEQDFESTLFSKKSMATKSIPRRSGSGAKGWKEEGKRGKSKHKAQTGESIKVPDGKTGAGRFNWKGGYARRMLYMPSIAYPLYYRKAGIQTDVLCRIEVDSSGKVVDVNVIRSSGHAKLDILAKNALRNARFSPGSNQQNDVGEVSVKFSLRN